MAHGVEIRTPLADRTLLEGVAPVISYLRPGAGKRALGATPSKPLPRAVLERTKTGFSVPLAAWTQRVATAHGVSHSTRPLSKGQQSRQWSQAILALSNRSDSSPTAI